MIDDQEKKICFSENGSLFGREHKPHHMVYIAEIISSCLALSTSQEKELDIKVKITILHVRTCNSELKS